MEISDLKSAAKILTRYYTIQKLQGLANEILYICVAQWTVKIQDVKVRGPKKCWSI